MTYQFIDAYSSVLTADASIISGSGVTGTRRPIVQIGSVLSSIPVTLSGNTSVSGTINIAGNPSISGQVGASIIGLTPVTFSGSPSVSGAVTIVGNVSVSGTVGASIIGQLPAGTAPIGSVATLQGTNPWIVDFQNSSILAVPVGSVITIQQAQSIVGTYAEDATHTTADKGLFVLAVRNDTVASFAGANTEYSPIGVDSAGRVVTKPFAPNESLVSGVASVVSASVTQLLAVAGAGLRNYVTDILVANTGSVVTQVTFRDGDASIIGRTLAPATGGSNIHLGMPMRTGGTNHQVDIVAGTSVSVLTVSAYGYKAP